MSAGIRYTDTGGNVTSFDATSPKMAIERLSSIRGYNATPLERSAMTAFGERTRRGGISARGPQERPSRPSVGFASGNGRLTHTSRVTDVKIVDGKLVKVVEDGYQSESGAFIPTGTHESRVESEN